MLMTILMTMSIQTQRSLLTVPNVKDGLNIPV
jgi:hypothetical protein